VPQPLRSEDIYKIQKGVYMSKSKFEEEHDRIRKEIWSLINVENRVVIDVGVGLDATSTKTLIDKGASVITVDTDIEALGKHKGIDTAFVCCDIRDIPFKPGIADAVLFNFTLHEIDPLFHDDILSEMASIASQVIIIEPSPGTTEGYKRFETLWRESMHAVGKFEDYQPVQYWETLVQANGFNLVLSRTIEHREDVPPEAIEDMIHFTTDWLEEENVPEKYMNEAKNLREYAKKVEMKLSDITVVIGQSKIAAHRNRHIF